jgi:transcriptional regulator with XRE-family HTH domain
LYLLSSATKSYLDEIKRMKKIPNPVDRHVGSRVRMRRVLLGMSQEKLGEALSLTFQQVQKYEKGTNRIGASRLSQIAKILNVQVEFFFEGAPADTAFDEITSLVTGFAEGEQASYISDIMSTSDGLQLARAFSRIQDPKRRRMVITMANTLAGEELSDDSASSD